MAHCPRTVLFSMNILCAVILSAIGLTERSEELLLYGPIVLLGLIDTYTNQDTNKKLIVNQILKK